jgi:hypothetical protein
VESRAGTGLPADYKQFINAFGEALLLDSIQIPSPFHWRREGSWFDLVTLLVHAHRMCRDLCAEAFLFPVFPAQGGLLPWASDINGNCYYWNTRGSPDDWSVVVLDPEGGALHELMEYAMSMTGFLAAVVNREIDPLNGCGATWPPDAPLFQVMRFGASDG